MVRILIADDERIERTVLYRTLHRNLKERCDIFQAQNGREAVAIHEEKKIQIAILDIEMPGINGIQAAQLIRKTDPDCSIIFLTAFDEFSYARKAITVRAMDYLLKPYDEKELMLVLEEAIRLTQERERKAGREEEGPWFGTGEALWRQEEETEDASNVRVGKVAQLVYHYIQQNYMYDISMQDMARITNYSEAYFCKLFKQCFNQNFTSYLAGYRVKEAKKLLEQPTVNIKDVGQAVGYMDSNYFARVFKRITGKTPTEYRGDIFSQ